MPLTTPPVSDMVVTVKSREVQRALLAEMAGDRARAARHFLAAAHLELVLADDYRQAGDADLAFRSLLSAASCFWRAGDQAAADRCFAELAQGYPARSDEVREVRDGLVARPA
jgi:hypothetical protein